MYFSKDLRLLLTGIGAMLPSGFFRCSVLAAWCVKAGFRLKESLAGDAACSFLYSVS